MRCCLAAGVRLRNSRGREGFVRGRWSGVYAGGVGFWGSGRGQCRVAAFGLSSLRESDFLFITVSHCAWRHVISLSKATKKRSKENAFNHATLSVHSVQFLFIGAPKARCSPERRMCEPLLLANPDTNTLRPVRSRASTICRLHTLGPVLPEDCSDRVQTNSRFATHLGDIPSRLPVAGAP